jgi:hypothetical protein
MIPPSSALKRRSRNVWSGGKRRSGGSDMDAELTNRIKILAITAVVSDDELMERLVLKGGNALDLVHGITHRASVDVDFSMDGDFEEDEIKAVENSLRRNIEINFRDNGLEAFDIGFAKRPPSVTDDLADFWGGYQVTFKVKKKRDFDAPNQTLELQRKTSLPVGARGSRTFKIEISKHEYCDVHEERELENYKVRVYTPALIVIEKLRAICQQHPDYLKIVKSSSRKPRAKDFFDIYVATEEFQVDLSTRENLQLITKVFEAKRVPIELLDKLEEQRSYHQQGYSTLATVVRPDYELEDFNFYFEYVIQLIESLKALWDE